jgi:phage N-6-adenine-methyltransferase
LKGVINLGQDNYRTPDYLFDHYDKKYHFVCDVAASVEDHKCHHYYTKEQNGLWQPWFKSNFCNPPYSRKNGNYLGDWACRGYMESRDSKAISLFIMPLGLTSKWFKDVVKNKARIELPDERIEFINPITGLPDDHPRNDNMIIIYGPGIKPGIESVHIPKK